MTRKWVKSEILFSDLAREKMNRKDKRNEWNTFGKWHKYLLIKMEYKLNRKRKIQKIIKMSNRILQ